MGDCVGFQISKQHRKGGPMSERREGWQYFPPKEEEPLYDE